MQIRLSLKQHKDVAEPTPPKQSSNWFQTLRKYFAKLLKFPKRNNKMLPPAINKQENVLLPIKEEECPDEIVFILLPDKKYDNSSSSPKTGMRLQPPSNTNDPITKAEMLKRKLYSLSETRVSMRRKRRGSKTPKRKIQQTQEKLPNQIHEVTNNCIRRRKDAPLRHSIRHKLAQKTNEIDRLYKREYALTQRLTHKCQLHKLHNELYAQADQRLEISIGQIQRNVEQYAEQIIQTEQELRELKHEIKQDISIVNNLKHMALSTVDNANDCGMPLMPKFVEEVQHEAQPPKIDANAEMQFVDNIYEFCDNNASMLV